MNLVKTDIHAKGRPSCFSVFRGRLSTFSACDSPHDSYIYWGMHLFTSRQPPQLKVYLLNEIEGFFNLGSPLPVTCSELIRLVNR